MPDIILDVHEIFTSIQGEGPLMGRPASFLRLSGCVEPLCPWCDTKQAWGPGKTISVEEVASRLIALGNRLCIITGGEPFLQWESGLNLLERLLLTEGIEIQYETSGKVLIPADCRGFKVCSPKYLANIWHYLPENSERADCFKFVAGDELKPVQEFITKHNLDQDRVWIMPMGTGRDEQLTRSPKIWEFCVKHHYNFSPRLHTLFFNNQQGV
ncbi:7-carboxy-7-deazaguanine synthase QueE [Desulfotalea psychrophila]|uniref:7-carboxy-7-deazaguanine synthase n=1 Tax=Desulfotalea psychrophila (strain LSv54 / DSM 12343) TaxID=177439 RepID=Q6ARY0_DESPS|nr:7-carboxy-7-deazaguanine synthase QueE [Desulfotalea psychrophila]CAG34895.1 conserved hypothetical protein [Desulfotalea psychrophila LSv54]